MALMDTAVTHSVAGQASALTPDARRAIIGDCAFLALIVLLSALPYVTGLGLYSDDWAILANLRAAGGSLPRMWQMLMDMGVGTRPVQGILLISLYALFGVEPLGYHLANTLGLAGIAVLFYLSLRRLGVPRPLALAVPPVFALLPHYSTDRFWIAAFQANAAVLLYFISLYADLRFIQGRTAAAWTWKAVGALALIGSVLAYEVTGALFLVNILVLAWAAGLQHTPRSRQSRLVLAGLTVNMIALALSVAFKLATTVRAGMSGGLRFRVLRIFTEGAPVHFGEYGIGLPGRVVAVLRSYPDAAGIAVSALVGMVVLGYLRHAWRAEYPLLRRPATWLGVMGAGVVVYAAGYGVSLTTWEIGFHSTGANNRTAVGAAIGTALVLTGIAGLASALLRGQRVQRSVFSLLVALTAASGTLIINAIASHWSAAAERQQEIIAVVRSEFANLPAGTTLLLDGLCPYIGPAPVFATDWDVKGMLELEYGERSLNGDVIKPNTEVLPEGVRTTLFDDWIRTYAYGDRLRVLHVGSRETAVLTDEAAARAWLETVSIPGRAPCAPYTDGDGIEVF